jgi:hypothetical protein
MGQTKRMQFSLKDLFLTVTLLAIGLSCLLIDWRTKQIPVVPDGAQILLVVFLSFAGIAMIGAAVGAPFHKKKIFSSLAVVAFGAIAVFTDFWPWLLNLL